MAKAGDRGERGEYTAMTSPGRHRADWLRNRERGSMSLLRVMSWISMRLGRRAGRAMLHLITAYFLLFAPAGRTSSRRYLGRVVRPVARWR